MSFNQLQIFYNYITDNLSELHNSLMILKSHIPMDRLIIKIDGLDHKVPIILPEEIIKNNIKEIKGISYVSIIKNIGYRFNLTSYLSGKIIDPSNVNNTILITYQNNDMYISYTELQK